MGFGKFLDKAKETADVAKEKAQSVTNLNINNATEVLKGMIEDLNNSLPVLKEYGYQMNEFEIEVGGIPSIKPHFIIAADLDEEKEQEMLEKLSNNKIGSLIAKALIQSNYLQKNIKIGDLKFTEIEIEASLPPKITIKFQ